MRGWIKELTISVVCLNQTSDWLELYVEAIVC